MPAYDRLMTDPPADEVVRALLEATETANRLCRVGVMKADKAAFEKFAARDLARKAEGSYLWLADGTGGTTYPANVRQTLVGLAWWTTPQGRKLVKVAGRRTSYEDQRDENRFGPPEGGRPPV